eukprot:Amastigsp_a339366_263.p3 type:complete len:216 gc:universal Amastigsp_a339366_263:342-989(+)
MKRLLNTRVAPASLPAYESSKFASVAAASAAAASAAVGSRVSTRREKTSTKMVVNDWAKYRPGSPMTSTWAFSAAGKCLSSATQMAAAMGSKVSDAFADELRRWLVMGRPAGSGPSARRVPGNPPPMSRRRSLNPFSAAKSKTRRTRAMASSYADGSWHPEPTWNETPMMVMPSSRARWSSDATRSIVVPNLVPKRIIDLESSTEIRTTSSASGP